MSRLLLFLLFPLHVLGQGQNITLLDHWSEDTLTTNSSNVRYNECWGFERDEKEYAVAGSTEGTHVFEITTQHQLKLLGFIEGRYNHSLVSHRDYATYQHYLYAVCDEGQSSLQIIDLSSLPDSLFLANEIVDAFSRVHNIFIDTNNALLYACTVTTTAPVQAVYSMQVYSLFDPLHPVLVYTGPGDIPEVHDVYVRNNIAYLSCGNDGLRVYDFSIPSSPQLLQNLTFYQDQGYNHQGWLSPDGETFIFGDETEGKRLKRCSVNHHLLTIDSFFGTNSSNNSVPHNIVLSDHFAYVAYYNEGLRIYDIRHYPTVEVAAYDTYPIEETVFKMKGAWGVYPNYSSKRIVVSDRVHGLFLFDFREDVFAHQRDQVLV